MKLIIMISVFAVISLIGFIASRVHKRRMRDALGREVNENELTSLSSWMQVSEAEDQQRNNAESNPTRAKKNAILSLFSGRHAEQSQFFVGFYSPPRRVGSQSREKTSRHNERRRRQNSETNETTEETGTETDKPEITVTAQKPYSN